MSELTPKQPWKNVAFINNSYDFGESKINIKKQFVFLIHIKFKIQ